MVMLLLSIEEYFSGANVALFFVLDGSLSLFCQYFGKKKYHPAVGM